MKIIKASNSTVLPALSEGESQYVITLDGKENAGFQKILEGWLDALEFHEMKSRDYSARTPAGRSPWSLGLKGEWPGITRKIQKLHSIIWEGKDVLFEGGQEIMYDLMGAIGLMILEQREISDKYSASWRNNAPNKPTFGPGPSNPVSLSDGLYVGSGRIVLDSRHAVNCANINHPAGTSCPV
jgi:hypothetical protein